MVEEKMRTKCFVRVESEFEERKRMSSFGVVAHPFIVFFSLLLFVDCFYSETL